MIKICECCGDPFEARMNKQIVCPKPECKRYLNRKRYANKLTKCMCEDCGKPFSATGK